MTKLYHVGSGIHGDLLSPNDIDIYLEVDTLVEFLATTRLLSSTTIIDIVPDEKMIAVSRHGDLNIIVGLGMSVKEYTDGFDINLVRGYRDLSKDKLVLSNVAKEGLKNKSLEILNRNPAHEIVMKKYDGTIDEEENTRQLNERAHKYLDKLPAGYTFSIKTRKKS